MPFNSLSGTTGYLSVGTSPVRLTANQTGILITRYPAHTIFVEQHPSNTSNLYLCRATTEIPTTLFNSTTGVGVLKILPAPFLVDSDLTGLWSIAFTVPFAPGGLNAADYYLIADSASQKAVVSVIQA